MSEIIYKKTTRSDTEDIMKIRFEMLREVNALSEEYVFPAVFADESRNYFENGEQATVLAFENETAAGCASLAYIRVMPTFDHPTGIRAHLMNVYTKPEFRRRGIAKHMIGLLIEEAKEKKVTEISLDTTEMGRPLYEALGFVISGEGMVMELRE